MLILDEIDAVGPLHPYPDICFETAPNVGNAILEI